MFPRFKIFCVALVSSVTVLPLSQLSRAADTCDDFLAVWDRKPAELEFVQCKRIENPQYDRLAAAYVVSGTDAAQVEQFLQQQFDMVSLRFLCCGWDSISREPGRASHTSYTDSDGYYFQISMGSEETLLQERKDWPQISKFYVRVTKHLGSP